MKLDDVVSLKQYLINRLSKMSDADPVALTDYIIALLKHEKPIPELKAFCISQLEDFLHTQTTPFIESLFRKLETGQDDEPMTISAPAANTSTSMLSEPSSSMQMEEESVANSSRDFDSHPRRRSRSRSPEHRRQYPQDNHHHHQYPQQYSRGGSRYAQRGGRGGRHAGGMMMPPMMPLPMFPFPGMRPPTGAEPFYSRKFTQPAANARSETRLVIDKIPIEFCTISHVNDYFQKFGAIVNITVHPEIQRARLEYSSPEEAKAAYTSPEVIFNNRFVKVYWDHDELPAPKVVETAAIVQPRPGLHAPTSPNPNAPMDEEKAAAEQKRQELLKGVHELQKQKQELLEKYITQQKELLAKLENKVLGDTEKTELINALKSVDELIKSLTPLSKASPQTTPIFKGGPVRGGGMTAFRGGRGASMASAFASRAAHRMDLRPTALMMKPIPSRVGRDIGSLRKLFEPYGQIKNISLLEDGSSAIISFNIRADAEKALHYMAKSDLGEPFELSWVASSNPNTTGTQPQQPPTNASSENVTMDDAPSVSNPDEDDSHWKR